MNPKDMVYNLLSEKISTGEIQPDGKFTEGYLVENLGLSRTPIREAPVSYTHLTLPTNREV